MTKHNVVVPEEIADIALASAGATETSLQISFPTIRGANSVTNFAKYKKILTHLELGGNVGSSWMNAWIDSMKASSPTSILRIDVDDEYQSWLKEHPSALTKLDEITASLIEKKLVMFLDYDGTLSPIVEDPEHAYMSDEMRETVKDLAKQFPTAIVSGRGRDKVQSLVNLAGLYYAGSHGMDIKVPNHRWPKHNKATAKPVIFQPASEYLPMISQVYGELIEATKSIPGSRVENNKFCLSVHYRCVDERKWNSVAENVKAVMKDYPKLHITQGRKVLEIRPTIKWDKGKALEYLLESLGFTHHSTEFLPIYIGDDHTDEDAFKVLREKGMGFGILVSKHAKETNASYSLREPTEVMQFLRHLVEWKILNKE